MAEFVYDHLAPDAYRHPADQAATAALRRIPHFEALMRRLLGLGIARRERNFRLASSVRLGPDQLPRVWNIHSRATAALGIDPVPELYLLNSPELNAYTIGADRPIVVIHSRLVEVFDDSSLEVVLAHEAGHVHCNHFLYTSVLRLLTGLMSRQEIPIFAGLPVIALELALLAWHRAAELSSDRAAGIVTGEPRAVCGALLGLAGGTAASELSLDAFIRQGREYKEPNHPLDAAYRLFDRVTGDHPLAVLRVGEFLNWVDEGNLGRILGGDFSVRRTAAETEPAGFARRQPAVIAGWSRQSHSVATASESRRTGSEFDRLARDYTGQIDDAVAEGSGLSVDEMSARIERWLQRDDT